VPGEYTEIEIGRTASRVADADIDGLAFEDSGRLRRSRRRQNKHCGNAK
jgi:hypothetical protein